MKEEKAARDFSADGGKEDYDDDDDESVQQKIDKLKHRSTEAK